MESKQNKLNLPKLGELWMAKETVIDDGWANENSDQFWNTAYEHTGIHTKWPTLIHWGSLGDEIYVKDRSQGTTLKMFEELFSHFVSVTPGELILVTSALKWYNESEFRLDLLYEEKVYEQQRFTLPHWHACWNLAGEQNRVSDIRKPR